MATNTPGTTARHNAQFMVSFARFVVNYNDPGISAGNLKQWLPAGAVIIGTDVNVVTAFNAGTTNVLSVGVEATTFADVATSAAIAPGTVGLKQNIAPTAAGLASVPLAADSQLGVLYTQTGTAATAGQAIVIVKFVENIDM
jgi:hypothetical protein